MRVSELIGDVLKRAAERAEQRAILGAYSDVKTGCVIRSPEAVVAGRTAALWRECIEDLEKDFPNVQG